jgi:hypothetical protein
LSYFETHGFTRPCRGESIPVQGLKALSTPYLEEFETCMEIFCDMCSRSWLVSHNRPENSTKKNKYQYELQIQENPYKGMPLARDSLTLLKPPCETNHPVAYEILSIESGQVTIGWNTG